MARNQKNQKMSSNHQHCNHNHNHNHNKNETILESINRIQQRRVTVYTLFEQGIKEYLNKECSASDYEQICVLVTDEFKECSIEIKTIIENLSKSIDNNDIVIYIYI